MLSTKQVVAVMLTANRAHLVGGAYRCFDQQTHPNKRLLVLDTGADVYGSTGIGTMDNPASVVYIFAPLLGRGLSVGDLRNTANKLAGEMFPDVEYIAHWDDDDWSDPNRLQEQTISLEAHGALATGYSTMPFWRNLNWVERTGEAWEYNGGICGTSLCYRYETWRGHKFGHLGTGEDTDFLRRVKTKHGVDSVLARHSGQQRDHGPFYQGSPMMVARIHGANTSTYDPQVMRDHPATWRRAPELDAFCAKVMSA